MFTQREVADRADARLSTLRPNRPSYATSCRPNPAVALMKTTPSAGKVAVQDRITCQAVEVVVQLALPESPQAMNPLLSPAMPGKAGSLLATRPGSAAFFVPAPIGSRRVIPCGSEAGACDAIFDRDDSGPGLTPPSAATGRPAWAAISSPSMTPTQLTICRWARDLRFIRHSPVNAPRKRIIRPGQRARMIGRAHLSGRGVARVT